MTRRLTHETREAIKQQIRLAMMIRLWELCHDWLWHGDRRYGLIVRDLLMPKEMMLYIDNRFDFDGPYPKDKARALILTNPNQLNGWGHTLALLVDRRGVNRLYREILFKAGGHPEDEGQLNSTRDLIRQARRSIAQQVMNVIRARNTHGDLSTIVETLTII